jgi:catalase
MQGTNWSEVYLNEEGGWENGSEAKEAVFFDKLAIQIREAVFQYNAANKAAMRANHAKILAGFSKAVFRVNEDVPAELAFGFLVPGAAYETTVRFSNAAGKRLPDDAIPDPRGIALRLHTTDRQYDLLMTSAEIHHAGNATEAMVAINAGVENEQYGKTIAAGTPGKEMIMSAHSLNYLVQHAGATSGARIANTLHQQMMLKVQSLSTESFWSRAPFAIGPETTPGKAIAVKFRLRPAKEKPAQEVITAEKELGKQLEAALQEGDIVFYFEVQRYLNPASTPIEDSTKAWTTPFEKLAELIIPRGSRNEADAIDKLSFTPWNVDTRFFRPLGSMNRARQKVYDASWHERENESPQS